MNQAPKIRVRFAPSPTGELHVGNARTALFNWLFAGKHGGDFILRIEDTDRVRTSEVFEKGIVRDLRWLGINWDEGPEAGGDCGPYHQFQRLDIYKDYMKELLEAGKIYPCYCTEEELEIERNLLLSKGLAPRYMGRCCNISAHERAEKESEGRKAAYRFRIGEGQVVFEDLIRGEIRFDCKALGDFIIVRSNGIPSYNFAVVIDDHLMEISHVIRGEDHLSNTALQILLYQALGFNPPRFAHHSLILGKDRSKLSKRHGSVAVKEFREKGILPDALVNYLSLLGSSSADGKEVANREEIIAGFSLDRAGKSGAIFDADKLRWVNGIYIRQRSTEALVEELTPFIQRSGFDIEKTDKARLQMMVDAVRNNLSVLSDIDREFAPFFETTFQMLPEAGEIINSDQARHVLKSFHDILKAEERDESYSSLVGKVQRETGLKGKSLYLPIRAALTGRLSGPELDKIYLILGRQVVLKRLEKALEKKR